MVVEEYVKHTRIITTLTLTLTLILTFILIRSIAHIEKTIVNYVKNSKLLRMSENELNDISEGSILFPLYIHSCKNYDINKFIYDSEYTGK